MKQQITSQTAKPGDTYQREVFEVHTYNPEDKKWWHWRRNAKTLEEARGQLRERKKEDARLKWLIDFGPLPAARIVHVKATCTVIE